jgi:hypothetical protein
VVDLSGDLVVEPRVAVLEDDVALDVLHQTSFLQRAKRVSYIFLFCPTPFKKGPHLAGSGPVQFGLEFFPAIPRRRLLGSPAVIQQSPDSFVGYQGKHFRPALFGAKDILVLQDNLGEEFPERLVRSSVKKPR